MDSEWVMCENEQSSDDQIRPSIDINILVVDDDSTTLAIVASMLQIFSYKVETAKNPLDALATLRMQSGVFDLVLTDLHMPYMNGFELQKQVQKEFKLPVIMMSADDDESVMLQSVKSGILFFIPKPVNPEDLKDVWQFALRSKKGKSVVIEEIPPTPTPLLIDLGDDGYDDNQGHQSLSGPGSTSSENASASGAEAAAWPGALVPMNQPVNKRGNRSPPPEDGKEKGSGSMLSKKACCRPENMLVDAPAGRRRRPRRPKVIWTNSLHNRFLLAINHLSFDKAVPKKILEFMNVPGLTRENVASHLQKYRLFLKKVAENGVAGATRMLADRILLRSTFASGYPIQMMLQTAQQLYPQLPRRPSQPLLLPPPPQAQSQSPPTTTTNNNNNSSIPSSTGPVGIPTLLTNNQPAPANVVQQPVPVANLNGTSTTTATAGNGVAANSNALVNHGGNNGFVGGVNPMQAWQQQNQVRVGPFAGTTYPSNNNVGSPNNYLATNNSAGVDMIGGNMAGYNQLPAGGGVPNGINGIGGARLIGTVNGLGLNGNMMNGVAMGNRGSGANFDYGQVGGAGSFSGGVSGANNPMVAVQAPQVLLNNNYQQQNANAALPPPPPQTQHLQLSRLANLPKGNFNNSNNNAENEQADAAENSDPAFGSGGVFLDQDNALPPPNYQVLIEDIHCDISEISFEEEDQNDQLIPTPKTQVQNPDPFAAGPSRVQENAPNTEQSLGLQQLRIEDLIDPFRLMNIENLPQEIDWDALMDAILQDDFAPLNWRE